MEAERALYTPKRTPDKIQVQTDPGATNQVPLSLPQGNPLKIEKR
jgi:hypothetical protein